MRREREAGLSRLLEIAVAWSTAAAGAAPAARGLRASTDEYTDKQTHEYESVVDTLVSVPSRITIRQHEYHTGPAPGLH